MRSDKSAPVLFLVGGVLLIWLGVTGRLGVVLASIFTPEEVGTNG